ncbi:zinc-binding dehydrogenase [Ramlibacter monticola]|uniref:Zinc-binding dehydrogenase n=1 Tax=Ramlibacter monticola TaxID=1926872 RepID=A0A936Z348_9BURK|nr:zinc-binding dehydrogenase [Ramlibacter monticola]MBL0393913.1 zinc-binding dehydrogenase [Ramlibacter monticola]
MKAARVHAWGEAPRIEQVPDPAGGAGLSLVRMHAATVGHIDRSVWSGSFLRRPTLPYVPGVEAAGVVVRSSVFQPGERVWLRGAGLGIARDGTWRELVEAPDHALGALPSGVSFALGSAFFSPCTSAWVALHEVGHVHPGERVLVTGATGAVGSITLQLARAAGAQAVAVVFDDAQAGRLPPGTERIPASELRADAPLLIDTVGGAALPLALRGVAPGGRAVLVGYAGGTQAQLDLPELLQRDVALLPLNMLRREAAGRAAAPRLLQMLERGELQLAVTTFPLEEAARALEWIAMRGHAGRAVLTA